MTRSIPKSVKLAATILLAIPLFLRADSPESAEKLVYVQPTGVAQNTRAVAHPTRDGAGFPKDFSLLILCPEHTGLTVQEHPSIFWYMNKPVTGHKCRVSVTVDGEPEPLFEKEVDPEKAVGIQRIDLKEVAKGLEPKIDYKISVTLLDPKDHAKDWQSSGHIERIAAPEKLISKLLTRPTPAERAVVYAKQGIWYDALAAISDQIAADPKNKARHQERADLLRQVSITDAATYDEKVGTE